MTVYLPEQKQIANDKSKYTSRNRERMREKKKPIIRESIAFWWINTEILNIVFLFVPHWLAVLLVFSETIWGDSLTSIWSSLELEAIAPCTRHRLCQYIAMHRTEKKTGGQQQGCCELIMFSIRCDFRHLCLISTHQLFCFCLLLHCVFGEVRAFLIPCFQSLAFVLN